MSRIRGGQAEGKLGRVVVGGQVGPAARDTDSQAVCLLVGKTATVGLDHSTSQDGR